MRKIGDKVRWISSSTEKVGEITHIVEAGTRPHDQGVTAGGGGAARETVSYVVRAQKVKFDGSLMKAFANYWPVASLLQDDDTKSVPAAKPRKPKAAEPKAKAPEPKADTAPPVPVDPPVVEDNVETEKAA